MGSTFFSGRSRNTKTGRAGLMASLPIWKRDSRRCRIALERGRPVRRTRPGTQARRYLLPSAWHRRFAGGYRASCRRPPVALDPHAAFAAAVVRVVDYTIDDSDEVSADLHHQSTEREFVRAQADLLVPGRNMLPTEGFQIGSVHSIRAAGIWIKGAHAPSPRILAQCRVVAVAPGV